MFFNNLNDIYRFYKLVCKKIMSLLIGDQINVGYFFIPKEVVSLS
jgi:hypothetical protein